MTTPRAKGERPQKRLYAIPEAAEYLGRTPWAVREMIWSGKVAAVRDGRRILLDVYDLMACGHPPTAQFREPPGWI